MNLSLPQDALIPSSLNGRTHSWALQPDMTVDIGAPSLQPDKSVDVSDPLLQPEAASAFSGGPRTSTSRYVCLLSPMRASLE